MQNLNWRTVARALTVLWLAAAIAAPAQTFTLLHSFDFKSGAYPEVGLAQAADGNLYGTASGGGALGSYGTIFRIRPATGAFATIYPFAR